MYFQAATMFSIPWSIGAVSDPDGREKFDEFYRKVISGKSEEYIMPESLGRIDTPFPEIGLVYDYCYEVRSITYYIVLLKLILISNIKGYL